MNGIDMTPSERTTRRRSPEELEYAANFARECESVQYFAFCLETGLRKWNADFQAKVIDGAKQIQFEQENQFNELFKGTVN
jgi:hypothetical protein